MSKWRQKRLSEEYRERNRNVVPALEIILAQYYQDLKDIEHFGEDVKERFMKHINYLENSIRELKQFLGDKDA